MRSVLLLILLLPLLLHTGGCSSDKAEDLIDVAQGIDRKSIDTTRMGVNAFANESFAGSICNQYAEIQSSLKLRFVRILFNWDDNVQPSPGASLKFSFYDAILDCIPAGMDALVILTNVPSWMSNPANWQNGNPRTTFVERWVKSVANRYKDNSKIIGYQIWNEPNNQDFSENNTLQVMHSPDNYVELIAMASNAIRDIDSSKLIVNGATTSIAQNFPHTLNYNKALRDAGMQQFIDRYAIHYYGKSFERFALEIKQFLRGLDRTIWITESGKMGADEQLPYVEQVWPFLRENVSQIDRIYYYRFAENAPSNLSFGLKTPDSAAPVSNLYTFLRDR